MSAMQRLTIEHEGATSVLDYTVADDTLSILHVEVPPSLRGKGIAGQLVEKARALADDGQLKLVPICQFARAYLKRNPYPATPRDSSAPRA